MRKTKLYIISFIILSVIYNCISKSSGEEIASEKNRDMFGAYIQRGLAKTSDALTPGYIMFPVPNSASTYLVNRKGEVVHEWKGNYAVFNQYLMDDGSLYQSAMDPDYPTFGFGGPNGRIQKVTWNSKMLWDFEYAAKDEMVHHDFSILPNGNILALAYEVQPYEDAIANGRKPELIPEPGPWLEKIIEIEPQGTSEGKIQWEWHIADHLIQDFDESKMNFGNPGEHPELLDFNLGDSIPPPITQDSLETLIATGKEDRNLTINNYGSDIYHFNAIVYNGELGQIAVSSPHLNEVLIIDHSTSIEEAAGHSGGKMGQGGDFIYRWGNPENYRKGDSTNQKLFYQHDVRWIEKGKQGAGNITIHNNEIPMGPDSLEYSAIYEIKLPIKEDGSYELLPNGQFGPQKLEWNYVAKDTVSYYAPFVSGGHRMKNGNTFITEGPKGRLFEVSPSGDILWEYYIPFRGEIRKPNGDPTELLPIPFWVFRATFIPADHPALVGRVLKPLDPQPRAFIMPPASTKDDKEKDS
ncbi:MAG: aryl-sulfate sulfotransferase [Maribacter sp.]|nr:aryl-sulfate sulfotransferase [Maribacter sp.]